MFRLFLALNLLLLNLYACRGGFHSCKQKVIDSNAVTANIVQVPVKKHQRLLFSPVALNAKIIKHDPFLGLYLIEDSKGFKYPFRFNTMHSVGIAGITKERIIEGKIRKKQVGLNNLASFSDVLTTPGILTSSCCALMGLVTSEGIIEKEYLKRFIESKTNTYADIGIRVVQNAKDVSVVSIDPYLKNNSFQKGDIIVEYNAKKVSLASSFMQNILFSKIGTTQKLKIKRHGKIVNIQIKSDKRYGGGYISDTFLERSGIYFDKNLRINRLSESASKMGLKLCDTLIAVDTQKVNNQEQVREIMSRKGKTKSLLMQRDDFQFFINIE